METKKTAIFNFSFNDTSKDAWPEVAQARKEGYDAGFEEGKDAAMKEELVIQSQHTTEIVNELSIKMSHLLTQQEQDNRYLTYNTLQVIQAAVNKLFPHLYEKALKEEVIAYVNTTFSKLTDKQKVTVTVHPSLKESVQKALQTIKVPNLEKQEIIVEGDDAMKEGSCNISWEDGGMHLFLEDIEANIKNAIDQIAKQAEIPSQDASSAAHEESTGDEIETQATQENKENAEETPKESTENKTAPQEDVNSEEMPSKKEDASKDDQQAHKQRESPDAKEEKTVKETPKDKEDTNE